MKIVVVFDFPEIEYANSERAAFTIDSLSEDLLDFGDDTGIFWHIDNVLE